MSEQITPDELTVHSIIGEGTCFRGEFDLKGLLRIDGDFSGVIRTQDKILVSRNGRAECTMYAREVTIGGLVKGDIFATEKVEILSTGMVIGCIEAPRLIVQDGVIFHGSCRVNKEEHEKESDHKGEQIKREKHDFAAVETSSEEVVSALNLSVKAQKVYGKD
jgi:cytoskeletal protein CcmA (bactofilin family)